MNFEEQITEEIYGRTIAGITFQVLAQRPLRQQTIKTYYHRKCGKHPEFWNRTGSQWISRDFDVTWCMPREFESADQALDYAIAFCNVLLARGTSTKYNTLAYYLMRRDLPYQSFLYLLNRDYNPVGSNYGRKHSTWDNWPHLTTRHWAKWPHDLTGRTGRDVFNSREVTGYLFYDGNAPWQGRTQLRSYLDRLLVLKDIISKGNANEIQLP
jgi:hypothetical protein